MPKQWVTASNLIKRFAIEDFELLELIKSGLQPYSRFRKEPISCPTEYHFTSAVENTISKSFDALEEFEQQKQNNICQFALELQLPDIVTDELKNVKVIQTSPFSPETLQTEMEDWDDDSDPEWAELKSKIFSEQSNKGLNGKHSAYLDLIEARQKHFILNKLKRLAEEKTKRLSKVIQLVQIEDLRRQSWGFLVLPSEDLELKKISDLIREAIFRADDVAQLESELSTPSSPLEEKNPSGVAANYVFRKTGASWTIVYNGKKLEGLKGKGFEDIRFLVENKVKVFHVNELSTAIEGVSVDSSIKLIEDSMALDEEPKKAADGANHQELIYGEAFKNIKEEFYQLKKEKREAEEANDQPRLMMARVEFDTYKKYCSEYFGIKGKRRKNVDPTTRARNRIAKRIERALNTIKDNDESAWKHFHAAIRPIKSYLYSYYPDREINWKID